MFKTTYTPYMLHQPRKTITLTKSSAMGCTVSTLINSISKHLKNKIYHIDIPFQRSLISTAVSCNIRVEG